MAKVVVVTDSTAYIPTDLVKRYGIVVAPLAVIWEGKTLHDSVDITPAEFYARLKSSKTLPTTSQTTPAEFSQIFSAILAEQKSILAILISSRLSGTIDSALQVKQAMPTAPIEIVDSRLSAMAEGFVVLAAVRAVEAGAGLEEAARIAYQTVDLCNAIFIVDTLEYMHRGGRIGGAQRFLGTALNLKPILTIQDGIVGALETVRTKTKATDRMLDLVERQVGTRRPLRISPLHASAPEEALALMKAAIARFHPDECIPSEVSPTIGTHVGPGTIGIAYCAGI
jgi:DegV family protein with EDD domain